MIVAAWLRADRRLARYGQIAGKKHELAGRDVLRPLRLCEELAKRAIVPRAADRAFALVVTVVGRLNWLPAMMVLAVGHGCAMLAVASDSVRMVVSARMEGVADEAMPALAEQRNAAKQGRKGPN